ncbi:MAG TPA: hypothetical protein VHZ73_03800 [Vicinamibacterales bacterium]|jgi:hypothetical protein|nr:hypothetical protein [Vicinamibacterales bacterium]
MVDTAPLTIPADFTPRERFLVQQSELAIAKGLELERWTRNPESKKTIKQFELPFGRKYDLKNKAWGYFADVCIGGKTLTALGCLQEVEFGKITCPDPEQRLKDYVLGRFLKTSSWVYPDGDLGGFTVAQMLYCDANGKCGRYSPCDASDARDWRDLGTKYRWSLMTMYLHDFVMYLGPFKKVLKEAVAVVQHPDFVHVVPNPRPGYKLEVAIGYPFIDFAPIPNFFGFGPGKFAWAVKTFSFLLRDNNEVRCDMGFVAGARAKKVFDFGSMIPDPVYGTSDWMETMTLGLYKSQPFRDFLDAKMALQHAYVHQALMEGCSKIFNTWQAPTE